MVKLRSNAEYKQSQLTSQLQSLQNKLTALELSQKVVMTSDAKTFTNQNGTKLTVSFACLIVFVVLWILFLAKTIFCCTAPNNNEVSYNGGEVVTHNGIATTKKKQSHGVNDGEEVV